MYFDIVLNTKKWIIWYKYLLDRVAIKDMLCFQIILSLLAILGLLISLGEMLGRFKDKDRINFTKIMSTQLECPKDHPGAKKFINDFVNVNPDYKNVKFDIAEVEKVVFVGLWLGNSNEKTGRSVESVTSGTIKLKSFKGQVTKSLCSFEDLKNWASETPF